MQGFGLIGGFLLGIASSLHCAGMCGGISLALTLERGGTSGTVALPLRTLLAVHGGRLLSYIALGAIVGALGAGALAGVNGVLGHRLLRWGAGLTLGWMGLATLGVLPGPTFLDRALRRASLPIRGRMPTVPTSLLPLAKGVAWGFLPCAMVYGALIAAVFAGSATGGALTMAGFGLGTLPVLLSLGGAVGRLSRTAAAQGRLAVGLGLIVAGFASTLAPEAGFGSWCRTLIAQSATLLRG